MRLGWSRRRRRQGRSSWRSVCPCAAARAPLGGAGGVVGVGVRKKHQIVGAVACYQGTGARLPGSEFQLLSCVTLAKLPTLSVPVFLLYVRTDTGACTGPHTWPRL